MSHKALVLMSALSQRPHTSSFLKENCPILLGGIKGILVQRHMKRSGATGRRNETLPRSRFTYVHRLNQMGVVCQLDNKLRLYLACGGSTMKVVVSSGNSNSDGIVVSSHPPLAGRYAPRPSPRTTTSTLTEPFKPLVALLTACAEGLSSITRALSFPFKLGKAQTCCNEIFSFGESRKSDRVYFNDY